MMVSRTNISTFIMYAFENMISCWSPQFIQKIGNKIENSKGGSDFSRVAFVWFF